MLTTTNAPLLKAALKKETEFYTRYNDIKAEVSHYHSQLKGKTVLLNCGDTFESDFFYYFATFFNRLELKKLIAISYAGSPLNHSDSFYDSLYEEDFQKRGYKIEMTSVRDTNGNGDIDMEDVRELFEMKENTITPLEGDGDFRSEECVEILKGADVVITSPPFPLLRQYVLQLMQYRKKFLILGNQNTIACKEIFPLFKNNQIQFGYNTSYMYFELPYTDGVCFLGNICWFTNLEVKKSHNELNLTKQYCEDYLKYDNYDAIEVSKIKDIPVDYEGAMGVPITFLRKYSSDQFEILGISEQMGKGASNGLRDEASGVTQPIVCGKKKYVRVFIRNRHPHKGV